jgi:predicted nucleic acid-binding protein
VSYLIDINVLSELRRKQPDAQVVAWMRERPRQSLYLSVLTLGEIRKGIERLQDAERRLTLLDWLEVELPNYFVGRLLPVDASTADLWGRVTAQPQVGPCQRLMRCWPRPPCSINLPW